MDELKIWIHDLRAQHRRSEFKNRIPAILGLTITAVFAVAFIYVASSYFSNLNRADLAPINDPNTPENRKQENLRNGGKFESYLCANEIVRGEKAWRRAERDVITEDEQLDDQAIDRSNSEFEAFENMDMHETSNDQALIDPLPEEIQVSINHHSHKRSIGDSPLIKRVARPLSPAPPVFSVNGTYDPPLYHDAGAKCAWGHLSARRVPDIENVGVSYDSQQLGARQCDDPEVCKSICLRMHKPDDPYLCNYFTWNREKKVALFYFLEPTIRWNLTQDARVETFFWQCKTSDCAWFWRPRRIAPTMASLSAQQLRTAHGLITVSQCTDFASCQFACETRPSYRELREQGLAIPDDVDLDDPTCDYVVMPSTDTKNQFSFLFSMKQPFLKNVSYAQSATYDSFELICKGANTQPIQFAAGALPPQHGGPSSNGTLANVAPAAAPPRPSTQAAPPPPPPVPAVAPAPVAPVAPVAPAVAPLAPTAVSEEAPVASVPPAAPSPASAAPSLASAAPPAFKAPAPQDQSASVVSVQELAASAFSLAPVAAPALAPSAQPALTPVAAPATEQTQVQPQASQAQSAPSAPPAQPTEHTSVKPVAPAQSTAPESVPTLAPQAAQSTPQAPAPDQAPVAAAPAPADQAKVRPAPAQQAPVQQQVPALSPVATTQLQQRRKREIPLDLLAPTPSLPRLLECTVANRSIDCSQLIKSLSPPGSTCLRLDLDRFLRSAEIISITVNSPRSLWFAVEQSAGTDGMQERVRLDSGRTHAIRMITGGDSSTSIDRSDKLIDRSRCSGARRCAAICNDRSAIDRCGCTIGSSSSDQSPSADSIQAILGSGRTSIPPCTDHQMKSCVLEQLRSDEFFECMNQCKKDCANWRPFTHVEDGLLDINRMVIKIQSDGGSMMTDDHHRYPSGDQEIEAEPVWWNMNAQRVMQIWAPAMMVLMLILAVAAVIYVSTRR